MCDGYAATAVRMRTLKKPLSRGWDWTLLRISLLLLAISTTVYVTVPDYPWGTHLSIVLVEDRNGWLHEVFYIWVFCLVGVDLTYRFEEKSRKRFERGS